MFAAPGGFGKTTLLGACCRDAAARGIPVAWLSLESGDDPGTLDAYLPFAFQQAGLDVLYRLQSGAHLSGGAYPRTAILIQALAARRGACVLALDGLECVEDEHSAALLGHLFRNLPPSVHLALAFRRLPHGLDASEPFLTRAEILSAEDLTFSKAEIARFFDLTLSRRELADIEAESGGWPIALRIWRNESGRRPPREYRAARDMFDRWIEERFWSQFARDESEMVLDIGLFDWIDAELLDEVSGKQEAWRRVAAMPGLSGLLEPESRTAPGVYRLHPLLREHCATRCRQRSPARYVDTHRRIAEALARRGHTVAAMRHAVEANDPDLAGRILVDAGGVMWWLREGGGNALVAADSLLPLTTVASEPRLAMTRCAALAVAERLVEARQCYRAALRTVSLPVDAELGLHLLFTWAVMALQGCEPLDPQTHPQVVEGVRRVAGSPGFDTMIQGPLWVGVCYYHIQRAEFDEALAAGRRARRKLAGQSTYLTVTVDGLLGQIAMAQGRMRDALRLYRRAHRAATRRFLGDPWLIANVEVQIQELELEANRMPADTDAAQYARGFKRGGTWIQHYAAAAEVALALAFDEGGSKEALSVLDGLWAHARETELPMLCRLLAALRVSILADAGFPDEADRTWKAASLPDADADCLDLDHLSWRELEALGCARLSVLTARGDHDAGRGFAEAMLRVASDRGLVRTELRVLARQLRLEVRAGADTAAEACLARFLALYAQAGYARCMIAAGEPAKAVLERFASTPPDRALGTAAERLLAEIHAGTSGAPRFSGDQMAVLRRLSGAQDKQIASALGLTSHGVRYRLRGIFRKLGVTNRADAVRRARALGILSPNESA